MQVLSHAKLIFKQITVEENLNCFFVCFLLFLFVCFCFAWTMSLITPAPSFYFIFLMVNIFSYLTKQCHYMSEQIVPEICILGDLINKIEVIFCCANYCCSDNTEQHWLFASCVRFVLQCHDWFFNKNIVSSVLFIYPVKYRSSWTAVSS